MPKLLDSIALSIVLASCAPVGLKTGLNVNTSQDYKKTAVQHAQQHDANDGFECKNIQEDVGEGIAQCCLTIFPHKSCKETARNDIAYLNGQPVPNYAVFREEIPPAAYMHYLVSRAQNARDIASVLSAFIRYGEVAEDLLFAGQEVLYQGTADCDNQANLFTELLGMLGKKIGHDYKARVIGLKQADHAVAVFFDTDGKWKSFDFNLPFNEIKYREDRLDFSSASRSFQVDPGKKQNFFERNKLGPEAGKGARIDYFLNSGTLTYDGNEIAVSVDLDFAAGLNPNSFLKNYSWQQAESAHIHYRNGFTAYYHKGELQQISEPERIIYFENNNIVQIQYLNHPVVVREYFSHAGMPERRQLQGGIDEVFKNGILFQRIYAEGDIAYEVFHECGFLLQRNYRNGRVEWYDNDGRLTQMRDNNGK